MSQISRIGKINIVCNSVYSITAKCNITVRGIKSDFVCVINCTAFICCSIVLKNNFTAGDSHFTLCCNLYCTTAGVRSIIIESGTFIKIHYPVIRNSTAGSFSGIICEVRFTVKNNICTFSVYSSAKSRTLCTAGIIIFKFGSSVNF